MAAPHETTIRVRYSETDAMGYLHHANYFNYFEIARTELFRDSGGNYREMEERGYFLVVADLKCKYRNPARYDDLLTVQTWLERATPVKLVHQYRIFRDGLLLTEAESTLACVNREGVIQRMTPEVLPREVYSLLDDV